MALGQDQKIRGPFGSPDVVALTASGIQAIEVNGSIVIDGVTVQATGNRTINLTLAKNIPHGTPLYVKSKTAATESTIFGTSITGATITGVAGKTKVQKFEYDAVAGVFLPVGASVQID